MLNSQARTQCSNNFGRPSDLQVIVRTKVQVQLTVDNLASKMECFVFANVLYWKMYCEYFYIAAGKALKAPKGEGWGRAASMIRLMRQVPLERDTEFLSGDWTQTQPSQTDGTCSWETSQCLLDLIIEKRPVLHLATRFFNAWVRGPPRRYGKHSRRP